MTDVGMWGLKRCSFSASGGRRRRFNRRTPHGGLMGDQIHVLATKTNVSCLCFSLLINTLASSSAFWFELQGRERSASAELLKDTKVTRGQRVLDGGKRFLWKNKFISWDFNVVFQEAVERSREIKRLFLCSTAKLSPQLAVYVVLYRANCCTFLFWSGYRYLFVYIGASLAY